MYPYMKLQVNQKFCEMFSDCLPLRDKLREDNRLEWLISLCWRLDQRELVFRELMGRLKPRMLRLDEVGGELGMDGKVRGDRG